MKRVSLDQLTYSTFARLLSSTFQVVGAGAEPVDLRLIEATPYRATPATGEAESFSLVFGGPLKSFLSQGTYLVQHEELGAFDLFLVPVAQQHGAYQYQAIFNRLPTPKK